MNTDRVGSERALKQDPSWHCGSNKRSQSPDM